MCGKFTKKYTWRELHRLYSLTSMPSEALDDQDVVPSNFAPVVRAGAEGREAVMMKWGFVPAWSLAPKVSFSTINARSEEVAGKATYRAALSRRQRCIVPASGFYEPQRIAGQKKNNQWLFTLRDRPVLSIAGLWDRWDGEGGPLETFTLLTCVPNRVVQAVHDRMPCIVPPELVDQWLDPGVAEVPAVFRASGEETMLAVQVSSGAGGRSEDGPSLFMS